jgi:hypothetical protein
MADLSNSDTPYHPQGYPPGGVCLLECPFIIGQSRDRVLRLKTVPLPPGVGMASSQRSLLQITHTSIPAGQEGVQY